MGNLLCCVQVDQSTVAIKESFGKYNDVLDPGCHCVPWFIGHQIAGKLSLRVQQLDVRCETKTKVSLPIVLMHNHSTSTSIIYVLLCTFLLCYLTNKARLISTQIEQQLRNRVVLLVMCSLCVTLYVDNLYG